MKYYIVSIGAIFISLGIGILVGYNLNYDQELSKQQASIINDLDSKFNKLKDTNDSLEKSLDNLKGEYNPDECKIESGEVKRFIIPYTAFAFLVCIALAVGGLVA